jgi:hypothetical protein
MAGSFPIKGLVLSAVAFGTVAIAATVSFQQAKTRSAVAAIGLIVSPFDRVESVEALDRERPTVWIGDTMVAIVHGVVRFRTIAHSARPTGPRPIGFAAVAADPATRVLFVAQTVSDTAAREILSLHRGIAILEETSPIRMRLIGEDAAGGKEKTGYLLLKDLNLYVAAYPDSV